jgi:hypothetical protein
LYDPWSGSPGNCAEHEAAPDTIRCVQVDIVEYVEDFSPKLQLRLLCNVQVLEEGEIGLEVLRTIEDVVRRVAIRCAGRDRGECGGVEKL